MSTFTITDPVIGKLSMKEWVDEQIDARLALDSTSGYSIEPWVTFCSNVYTSFANSDGQRVPFLQVSDVRPIAEALGLEINRRFTTSDTYAVELFVEYRNVALFSMHSLNEL